MLPLALRTDVLRMLRRSHTFQDVARQLQIPASQIHGLARTNPLFRADLDRALMAGRDKTLTLVHSECHRQHHAGDGKRATQPC
ncbi:hypothetical protein [Streptomyces sp. cg36]|uniref:hypothetical protein n=1 Tax=Streptomyces sp. cg36 TaxID=3238798 RepID=UPI0034E2FD16